MLFVLIGLLLVASVFVLLMKKNRESLYLLGMCCSPVSYTQDVYKRQRPPRW